VRHEVVAPEPVDTAGCEYCAIAGRQLSGLFDMTRCRVCAARWVGRTQQYFRSALDKRMNPDYIQVLEDHKLTHKDVFEARQADAMWSNRVPALPA
jgi:hypothetical protein